MQERDTFDIHAMSRPSEPKDILAILREFRAEAARLQEYLDDVTKACEAELAARAV